MYLTTISQLYTYCAIFKDYNKSLANLKKSFPNNKWEHILLLKFLDRLKIYKYHPINVA